MKYQINCVRPHALELAKLFEAAGWAVNALDALESSIDSKSTHGRHCTFPPLRCL
jgi:hypothetical protein